MKKAAPNREKIGTKNPPFFHRLFFTVYVFLSNAVFGACFKGLSLYFLYQKRESDTYQNGLGYTSDTYPNPYPLVTVTPPFTIIPKKKNRFRAQRTQKNFAIWLGPLFSFFVLGLFQVAFYRFSILLRVCICLCTLSFGGSFLFGLEALRCLTLCSLYCFLLFFLGVLSFFFCFVSFLVVVFFVALFLVFLEKAIWVGAAETHFLFLDWFLVVDLVLLLVFRFLLLLIFTACFSHRCCVLVVNSLSCLPLLWVVAFGACCSARNKTSRCFCCCCRVNVCAIAVLFVGLRYCILFEVVVYLVVCGSISFFFSFCGFFFKLHLAGMCVTFLRVQQCVQ